jgi:hypothetical protein
MVVQNVLAEKDPTINTGWRIMDIDNWLGGNTYWIDKEEDTGITSAVSKE